VIPRTTGVDGASVISRISCANVTSHLLINYTAARIRRFLCCAVLCFIQSAICRIIPSVVRFSATTAAYCLLLYSADFYFFLVVLCVPTTCVGEWSWLYIYTASSIARPLLLPMSLSLSDPRLHSASLCKNGWTDGDVVWSKIQSNTMFKEHCVKRRSWSPMARGRGFDVAFAKVHWPLVLFHIWTVLIRGWLLTL